MRVATPVFGIGLGADGDIMHYFHVGSPLNYLIVLPDGQLERVRLDNNPIVGEQLQLLVKGGCWVTAILETGEYGLIGEAVSPGFEYADMALSRSCGRNCEITLNGSG